MRPTSVLAAVAMLAGLILVTTEAQAISRYNSQSMSCSAIQAVIRNEGAVILRWIQPPNLQRYDRYVYSSSQCYLGMEAVRSYVPSADSSACPVALCMRCTPRDFFEGRC